MHLSSYGLISLSGAVTKPEPGLGFADYQIAMANYNTALMLRARVREEAGNEIQHKAGAEAAILAPEARRSVQTGAALKKPSGTDAASLVRKFRS